MLRRLLVLMLLGVAPLTAQTPGFIVQVDTSVWSVDSLLSRVTHGPDSATTFAESMGGGGFAAVRSVNVFRLLTTLRFWRDSLRLIVRFEPDGVVPIDTSHVVEEGARPTGLLSWGLEDLHVSEAWALGGTGAGGMVADLDSGADTLHVEFVGKVAGGYNAASGGGMFGGTPADTTAYNDLNGGCRGHGTHTLGTAGGLTAGVGPALRLWVGQVFPATGDCSSFSSSGMTAMYKAVAAGARAINISISYGSSFAFSQALQSAKANGVATCVANGNDSHSPANGLAQDTSAFGMGSVGTGLTRSSWSNWGPTTDFAAPGENITSSLPGGYHNGYGGKSGTSMAAPHCTGWFGVVLALPRMMTMYQTDRAHVVDEAAAIARATADPLGDSTFYGAGLLRLDRAVAVLTLPPPTIVSAMDRRLRPGSVDTLTISGATDWAAWSRMPWLHLTRRGTQMIVMVDANAPVGSVGTVHVGRLP